MLLQKHALPRATAGDATRHAPIKLVLLPQCRIRNDTAVALARADAGDEDHGISILEAAARRQRTEGFGPVCSGVHDDVLRQVGGAQGDGYVLRICRHGRHDSRYLRFIAGAHGGGEALVPRSAHAVRLQAAYNW